MSDLSLKAIKEITESAVKSIIPSDREGYTKNVNKNWRVNYGRRMG